MDTTGEMNRGSNDPEQRENEKLETTMSSIAALDAEQDRRLDNDLTENVTARPTEASTFGNLSLLPHHRELLVASAVSPVIAQARGYRSVEKKAELKVLGFSDAQCRVPALLIPVWGVNGEVVLHQIRPDSPRANSEGKSVKYETPSKARMALDVHPSIRPQLGNPTRPLFITEGVRKADAAISKGLCCIALLGVWNFRGSNAEGGKVALPDWDSIALNDREVFIVFDSDVMLKPAVYQALVRLKALLERK